MAAVVDPNGCPVCGRDIDRLGGNPDCSTCAAEPAQRDWLYPRGDRPACLDCDRPVYLAGVCGHHYQLQEERDRCYICGDRLAGDLAEAYQPGRDRPARLMHAECMVAARPRWEVA